MHVSFSALEHTRQGTFQPATYSFTGDEHAGWEIERNGAPHLRLGTGYRLLQSKLCGICATDIDRRFMPYPLPQIIGHEVVAQDVDSRQRCVVEINDTPYYRGESGDPFSDAGLPTHTPGRMTLGIDRLPGGFGPYILAPWRAVIPVDDLDDDVAVLVEPFAAAVQAVVASPPAPGDAVAVLGPRRLGSLLITALTAYRDQSGTRFTIHALSRHPHLLDLCRKLGADDGIDLSRVPSSPGAVMFDIVYDTTGTVSGFELALTLARRELHLKSTNGRPMCGLDNLTAFVVDELALLPYRRENLGFRWPQEDRENHTLFCAPGVRKNHIEGMNLYRGSIPEAICVGFPGRLPRFDLAVASSLAEIDACIRPSPGRADSLVRPRGAILFAGDPGDNPLLRFIALGGRLRTSRCGDFHTALEIMRAQKKHLTHMISQHLITHCFPVSELASAFAYAQDKQACKVVVKHR